MNWNYYYEILSDYLLKYDYVFRLADAIIFLIYLIVVLYLLTFVIAARMKKPKVHAPSRKNHKIIVIYTTYNDNQAIFNSIASYVNQSYPAEYYDILVVTDNCTPEFVSHLQHLGTKTFSIDDPQSSLQKDYMAGLNFLKENGLKYDIALTMKAGNQVDKDTLSKINDAYYSGCDVIQTHRISKSSNENITILESISEEINNSIFREGHTALGLSSALTGSGMAFDFDLLYEVMPLVNGIGIEKQLETILLKRNIYIEYLKTSTIYEEKSKDRASYYNKRRGWFASQTSNLLNNMLLLPIALLQGKIDYSNKIIQWLLPSRVILFGIVALASFFLLMFDFMMAIKWIMLLMLLVTTFMLAIPNQLINRRFPKALLALPGIFLMSLLGLFRMKFTRED